MLLAAVLLLQEALYSRDVAPVLAIHCNRCHGDEAAAGGADTRTYESLKRTVNLGLMMELIEGRRGETRRMPKDAGPLDPAAVAKLRQWVESGAVLDREPPAQHIRRRLRVGEQIRIQVKAPGRSYVVVELIEPIEGRTLHREAAVVHDSHRWTLRKAAHWPPELTVQAAIAYASGPATLEVLP